MSIAADVVDRTLVVTIDRPRRRNAVDRATAEELSDAFAGPEADDRCDVAVLTGADGTFCSGADLVAIAEGAPNEVSTPSQMVGSRAPMGPTRLALAKPVIAAVEGHAVAGGLELALWRDLRVAAADAVVGVFSRRWGVPLIDGGSVRLPRLIGHGRAVDLMLTGRPVGAGEARQIGLVHRVVEPATARSAALELARTIAAFPQTCLRQDLAAAREGWALQLDVSRYRETTGGRAVLESGAAAAGARRFAEGAGRHGARREVDPVGEAGRR